MADGKTVTARLWLTTKKLQVMSIVKKIKQILSLYKGSMTVLSFYYYETQFKCKYESA